MPDPAERFIDAAIAPLGENPELQIAARQELAALIGDADSGTGDSLEVAAAQLERKRGGRWRHALYAVTGIVSVVLIATLATSFFKFREGAAAIGLMDSTSIGSSASSFEKHLAKNLTPEQKLLLIGDTRRHGKAERFEALWRSEPQNPAYFSDYVAAHLSDRKSLPPGFIDTARELDPGNAWFPTLAAAEAAKQAIDPSGSPVPRPGGWKLKPIKDPAKLDEAMALLHEAAAAKRFESHQIVMLRKRIPLLPKRTDNLDQIVPLTYMAGLTAPSIRFRSLADAVAAKAIRLAEDKDRDGFKRLLADWEDFTKIYARSEDYNLVDALVAMVVIHRPLKAFHEAADDLGFPEEAARLKARADRHEAWNSARRARHDRNADVALHSGMLAGMSLPVVSKQSSRSPVLQDADLKPGRLSDHATAGRLLALIGWLLFGIAMLACGLFRLRCSTLTRRLSDRFAGLLRPVDWLWIIGIGIISPLLLYVAISRFTPLGAREWSMKASLFVVPSGQFIGMLWLMIVLPLAIARRRLSLRGGAAGLAGGKQLFAWLAVVAGVAAIPVFGLTFQQSSPAEAVMFTGSSLLCVLKLYALVVAIRAMFSRQTSLLRRATLSRILLPVYAVGMLAMITAMLAFHSEEKHWITQDRLMEITVDAPCMTRFEYDVTQALKQELRDLLSQSP